MKKISLSPKMGTVMAMLLFALGILITADYALHRTLLYKARASAAFVLSGSYSAFWALRKHRHRSFALCMEMAFLLSMAGDILLASSFLRGMIAFSMAHVLLLCAFLRLQRPRWREILCVLPFLLVMLSLMPRLSMGRLTAPCLVYATLLSCMTGKALAVFFRRPSVASFLLLVGASLFFVSDLALALSFFGQGGKTTDLVCLWTYFPGQQFLALSVFFFGEDR